MNSDPTSLDLLHDIVAPAPVPWWPPAPGWYWVLGFVALVIVVLTLRGLGRWQRNRYRREALAELARQQGNLATATRRAVALAAMGVLLKRTAITAFSRERVAALTGPAWFAFLDRTGRTTAFSAGEGAALSAAAYDPAGAGALDEPAARQLAASVRQWIKRHRTDEAPGREGTPA